MATLVFSAVGAAIGGSLGGTVLGLSAAMAGRFVGAVIGRSIDQRLMGQGSEVVERGRMSRLRLMGTGEGDPLGRIWGRMRVPGQVIWASEFKETVSVTTSGGGGGKGGGGQPSTTVHDYRYSVSLALALGEGQISGISRIWADGAEVSRSSLNMRVYTGSRDQLPDPKIEAVEGAGTVPAYRGTAYVVIEDLDLTEFGNRVPQFSFEVSRPVQGNFPGTEHDPVHSVTGVAMLPGSGEYALATSPVVVEKAFGAQSVVNISTGSGKSDLATSLDALTGELPACKSVSLVVSWFGTDLRASHCNIAPRVEHKGGDAKDMPWTVCGVSREAAWVVPHDQNNDPVYGGTPCDTSVIEAIREMNGRGLSVMMYPFLLMTQQAGNARPDPYGLHPEQPPLPWRGRITAEWAPNVDGSPDGTAAAAAQVAHFFGQASATDFAVQPGRVTYLGDPDDWGYRRFILHLAALSKAAGGVESFCIGSEMRGLTQVRGPDNSFPAVDAFCDLAAEVRSLLGPEVKLSYAADWSEYAGYQPQDGSGDRFFHLDKLWADDNIDFIGIDNYMPLSDWRDGEGHADAAFNSIYDLDYLQSNVAGGEYYDWYYASQQDRDAQIRTPITDGAHDEPWIWRVKDIRSWWLNAHHERIGGQRQETPTLWQPASKPIRFTELGCAAIDKGTNQPNKFLDPKSSESAIPHYSSGAPDPLIQMQYLRAMHAHFSDTDNNPWSPNYGGQMVDMSRAYVWAWDARPYPVFPSNSAKWSDGANYAAGHWITGRATGVRLAALIEDICAEAGVTNIDTSGVHGFVRGVIDTEVASARSLLQPILLRYSVDVVERGGVLHFIQRNNAIRAVISKDSLVRMDADEPVLSESRASQGEDIGKLRLRFVQAGADYDLMSVEAQFAESDSPSVSSSEVPLAMTRAEAQRVAQGWLAEQTVAKETAKFALPPSNLALGPGDVVKISDTGATYRIDTSELLGGLQQVEAVRVNPQGYDPILAPALGDAEDEPVSSTAVASIARPFGLFLDLPLLTGEEIAHAPWFAATAEPWPGSVALLSAQSDAGYLFDTDLKARSRIGLLKSALGRAQPSVFAAGQSVEVELASGDLESIDEQTFLSGGNLCAIGDGSPGGWELLQFREAVLVAPRTYRLSGLLRGQLGTEAEMPDIWPTGSYFVRLDGTARQTALKLAEVGLERHYRYGPSDRPTNDATYVHEVLAFEGRGLRPLRPVHFRAEETGNGDMRLSWVRRTRIGGDSWDIPEVPLGEEREQYALRLLRGDTILREVMLDTPSWVYSAADQATDGFSAGDVRAEVAQISATVGLGAWAALDL